MNAKFLLKMALKAQLKKINNPTIVVLEIIANYEQNRLSMLCLDDDGSTVKNSDMAKKKSFQMVTDKIVSTLPTGANILALRIRFLTKSNQLFITSYYELNGKKLKTEMENLN